MLKMLPILVFLMISQSACSVVTVADAVVSTAATAVKTTAKVTGAVVDAVIPDGDDEED